MTVAGTPTVPRPRPVINQDNQFFWDGIARRELLVQQCADCRALRHPPSPMCPWCQSFDWQPLRSSGRGEIYSFVVAHRPLPAGFVGPVPIALVEMEEGWRLMAGIDHVASEDLSIGMAVATDFVEIEPGFVLPQFRPAKPQEIKQ